MVDETPEARPNYAVPQDIADVWRPLEGGEQARAEKLIASVARAIRRTWPDVDERIASGDLNVLDVADVIVWQVLPILDVSSTASGTPLPVNAKAYQETSGSESVSITLDGPGGVLTFVFAPWMVDVFRRGPVTAAWPRSRATKIASGYYDRPGLFLWPERGAHGSPR